MTEPKTRRQLRAALATVQNQHRALAGAVHRAGLETETAASYYGGIGTFTTGITNAVHPADFKTAKACIDEIANDRQALDISLHRAASELKKLGYTAVGEYSERLERDTQHFKAPDELPSAAHARRETLSKVIEALEIRGYATTKPTLEALISGSYGAAQALGESGADRLWRDINTALEVRAEQKRADERQATAKKVARLTKQDGFGDVFSLTFIPASDDFDPAAPKVSDLTPKPKKKPSAKKGASK